MRPLFAIAPLALAFALLGPATTEASPTAVSTFAAKVWHLVFDHGQEAADTRKTTGSQTDAAMAAAH
jgi:hypothetical protein